LSRRLALLLLPLALCGAEPAPQAPAPRRVEVGGGSIELEYAPGDFALGGEGLADWVQTSARAIESYYGRFPLERVRLELRDVDGRGVRTGRTAGGAWIQVVIGRESTRGDLRRDWVLPHEMVHLAHPSLASPHHWLEEGLATYVEPFARLEIGELPEEEVWNDLVEGLPQGLPRAGDRGLDRTPTWGRTYWGGALFCLLADVEIHKRTKNEKGLRDALRAIVAEGGTARVHWPIARLLEVGDRATGVPVLAELYARMRADPAPVDLEALWRELGVERHDGSVRFKSDAPLAAVRASISRRPAAAQPD
jgi:hypothetical protein